MSKVTQRKLFRESRRLVSSEDRAGAAQLAAQHLKSFSLFITCERIACYVSNLDEFDTCPLLQTILKENKQCYLPILVENGERYLKFARYHEKDPLLLNRYKILEPTADAPLIATEALELVLTPLLAFDRYGGRLGTGGGYYDRTFSFLSNEKAKQPVLVGLGYSFQETNRIEVLPHDIPLSYVLTEKGIIKTRVG